MRSAGAAIARLSDPEAEVSAHYVIAEDGRTTRLVNEDRRAWHAGVGCWGAVRDVNSHAIGIELANAGPLTGFPPFPAPQMSALEGLLRGILGRWSISPARVIAHSDMAPLRKFDPGPKFDWQRLALQGLSVWPAPPRSLPANADAATFRGACIAFGYDPEVPPPALLAAFRLRFRPGATGALDRYDVALAIDLGQRFPVDRRIGNP